MTLQNSKGTVYYGMHFYPGVAEYREPNKQPFRVFLNEDTIRSMDPTFAGRPVYVMHVDGVPDTVDEIRGDADGWVVESFYNEADGKHWAKFLVVSEKGELAIKRGMKLSNAYQPKGTKSGGLWNGVSYEKEITGGEYEHLAIVPNPRYEESVILTPDQFKVYNAEKLDELKRLKNEKGDEQVKFKIFKRAAIENSINLEEAIIELPKSKREMSVTQLVTTVENAWEEMQKPEHMANMEHMLEHKGEKMSLNAFVAKHEALCQELAKLKNPGDEDFTPASDPMPTSATNDDEGDLADEPAEGAGAPAKKKKENEDDEKKKKALQLAEDEEKEVEAAKKKNAADAVALEARRATAKAKADKLKNAGPDRTVVVNAPIEFSADRVQRGKAKYGS